jgi:PAS domain S-box-containing protein
VVPRLSPASIGKTDGRYEAALADLGSLALTSSNAADVVRAAVVVLEALLDVDLVFVVRNLPEQNAFSLESGADANGWLAPGIIIPAAAGSQADDALHSPTPVLVQDLAFDMRTEPIPLLSDRRFSSGILASIRGEEQPWGLLAAYSKAHRSFNHGAIHFVRAVTNAIACAIAYSRAQMTIDNLIENSPDPVVRFDAELRVEYANTAVMLATGYPAKELLGRTFRELNLIEAQLDGAEAMVRAVFRGRRERQVDLCLSTPLGDRFYRVRLVPELATDSSVRSVLVIARDMSEYKKLDDERVSLQQELFERDRRHEELVHQLLAEQQRSNEQQADANLRSEIVNQLTARETDILRLLAGGLTNRQIARRLHLSPGTVRNHLGRVFPKLDAIDRTQAAVRAVELGLIASEEG